MFSYAWQIGQGHLEDSQRSNVYKLCQNLLSPWPDTKDICHTCGHLDKTVACFVDHSFLAPLTEGQRTIVMALYSSFSPETID